MLRGDERYSTDTRRISRFSTIKPPGHSTTRGRRYPEPVAVTSVNRPHAREDVMLSRLYRFACDLGICRWRTEVHQPESNVGPMYVQLWYVRRSVTKLCWCRARAGLCHCGIACCVTGCAPPGVQAIDCQRRHPRVIWKQIVGEKRTRRVS